MESQKPKEMAFTKEEADLVLQTWDKMKSNVNEISAKFFGRVFQIDQSVMDKFDYSKKIDPIAKNTAFINLLELSGETTYKIPEFDSSERRMIDHGKEFFYVLSGAANQIVEKGRVDIDALSGGNLGDKHLQHHVQHKHFEAYSKGLYDMLEEVINNGKLDENARKAWGTVHQKLIEAIQEKMTQGRIEENNYTFSQYTSANLESWIRAKVNNPHNHDPLPHNPELVTLETRTFRVQTPSLPGATSGEQDEDENNKVTMLKEQVHGWVRDKTRDIIKDLLEGFSLDSLIKNKISLDAGALHFKGEWEEKLVVCADQRDFHPLTGEPFKATYLRTSPNSKQYVKKLHNYTVLSLPYDDKGQETSYSMLLFLPDDDKKLDDYVEFEALKAEIGIYEHTIISDSLPVEKVDVGEIMVPKLKFSIKANNVSKDDFISCFTEVNEKGTTAVVAYASYYHPHPEEKKELSSNSFVPADPSGPTGEKLDFVADRPFLAFIRENKTGHILFVTQVVGGPLED